MSSGSQSNHVSSTLNHIAPESPEDPVTPPVEPEDPEIPEGEERTGEANALYEERMNLLYIDNDVPSAPLMDSERGAQEERVQAELNQFETRFEGALEEQVTEESVEEALEEVAAETDNAEVDKDEEAGKGINFLSMQSPSREPYTEREAGEEN